MHREIILDTETTGLNPLEGHRIVEIGALEMVNKVLTGNKIHWYVNPERNMPEEAYRIHGISSEFLRDKPLFRDVADELLKFIAGAKLVIHNAPFDIKFLNHELSKVNLPTLLLSEAIDTLILARKAFPGARVNLDALCKRYKIDNSSRQFHGALKDAELLAKVYIELTGGRQVSFTMIEEDARGNQSMVSISEAVGNKIIIKPNEEEIVLHDEFIKKYLSK